jgi:hypothetical protein
MPACLWFLDSWQVSLEKKPKKEEKKGSKQIFTLGKALGNSKDAPKDWRKKSLFSCLSCLTCTALARALPPRSPLPNMPYAPSTPSTTTRLRHFTTYMF